MKKFNSFAALATVALASVFSFTSCQKDDDININKSLEEKSEQQIAYNDSVFTYESTFDCGNGGPASISNTITIPDLDLGINDKIDNTLNSQSVATRAGGIEGFISSEISGLFKYSMEKLYAYYFNKGTGMVYNELFGDKDAIETTNALNKINSNIEVLQNVMLNMGDAMTKVETSEILRKRFEYNAFATYTAEKYADFMKCGGDSAKCDAVIKEWGDFVTCDNNSYLTAVNYLQFLTSRYNSLDLTMPQLYDYWVYQTTAWEHDGLKLRANLRRADVALAETAYFMVKAYCMIENCKATSADADKNYEKVKQIYLEHENISFHPNAIVCQIKGVNVIMNKDLVIRPMKEHPWMTTDSEWSSIEAFMYGEQGHDHNYVLDHSLKADDVKAIYNFYNANRTEKMTFEQIMETLGFNLKSLYTGKRHVMTLADGASMENEGVFNRNYYFRYDNVAVVNEPGCLTQDFTIGLMWLDRSFFTRIFKWWHSYTTDDCQYFRIHTDRYNGNAVYRK